MTLLCTRTRSAALLLGVAASVVACRGLTPSDRDPDAVALSEIIELKRVGGDQPLRADGTARDTLEARIPRGASTRVVTFTTSAGHFALAPGGGPLKVLAETGTDARDSRLVARAVLVADTLPKTAVVSAGVGDFSAYLEVPFVK